MAPQNSLKSKAISGVVAVSVCRWTGTVSKDRCSTVNWYNGMWHRWVLLQGAYHSLTCTVWLARMSTVCLWCAGCDGLPPLKLVLDADVGESEERGNSWGSLTGADPSNRFHTRLRVTQQGKTPTKSLGVKRPVLLIFDPGFKSTNTQ